MNKTRILLVICLGLIMLGSIPAIFGAPTELNMLWDTFGGTIDVDYFASDDAIMNFYTAGNHMMGELYARTGDENHFGYGVYDFLTNVDARVEDGGIIQYGVERTDSKTSYGIADQSTYSQVGVNTGGWAQLTFQTQTNYASLYSANWGFQASNQFMAGSTSYNVYHNVVNGDNNVWLGAVGDGEIYVDHMSDGYTTGSNLQFGQGTGSFTNANVDQIGSGAFTIAGHMDNSLTWGGITSLGDIDFSTTVTFDTGFSWTDYSLSGN